MDAAFAGRRRLGSLEALFRPKSIAVVGASQDPRKIGGRPIAFLARYGFPGAVYPVNPQYAEVQGLPAYGSLARLPEVPDQVIVALPAPKVVDVVRECAAIGAGAAIVFSSGFAEIGGAGRAMQDAIAATVAESPLRVLGPNCIGMMNVPERTYGTFSVTLEHGSVPAGGIGIVAQSGAMGAHLLILARNAGIGFGRWVATGNEVDVDVADCIGWMAGDPGTRVIVCVLEGLRDVGRFRAALRLAHEARKPVVVLRMGSSEVGRIAAQAHTGAPAIDDAEFDAMLREAAAVAVDSLEALLDVAYVADHAAARGYPARRAARGRLGVVSLSGGAGVLMADVAARVGLSMPELPEDAQRAIVDRVPFAAARNPIDATAQANVVPGVFETCLDQALGRGDFDSLVVFLSGVPYSRDLGRMYLDVVRRMRKRHPEPLMVLSAIGPAAYRRGVERAGCLYMEDPTRACVALGALRTLAAGRSA
jgi:acyl-CoA synthetase (NDP forming)